MMAGNSPITTNDLPANMQPTQANVDANVAAMNNASAPQMPVPQPSNPLAGVVSENQPAPPQQPQQAQPPKPGSLFRKLMAGALMGLSAGLQGESTDEANQRRAETQPAQQQTSNVQTQQQST